MNGARARGDIVFALVVLAIAGVVWREAGRAPPPLYDPLGPGTGPAWICGALAVLALVILGRALLGLKIGQSTQSLILGVGEDAAGDYRLRPALALFCFAATIAYAAALTLSVTFLWATMGFLAVVGVAMGNRSRSHVIVALAIAVAGAVAINALFRKVFIIDLP